MTNSRHTREQRKAYRHQRAGEMRRDPTPQERKMMPVLDALGFKFQFDTDDKQILDFFHEAANVCIEIDGRHHRKGPDGRRDRRLRRLYGTHTIRIRNAEVDEWGVEEASAFVVKLVELMNERLPDDAHWVGPFELGIASKRKDLQTSAKGV